ncbi:4Fe-4S dicluster domain-containing protein [Mesobacillus zeae]|uniref:4Fe-4S ferredoxin-type domain-containing protein n=1 Tax=Mesobacillus zeae TaxID=1917180 RepID=A0A398BKZ4_9BACI|nr:4Fe-4S dicluster domain-containing protein [Mesobacillus zeae]RID88076.1 hypothetical protein D1970_04380 [Mesobacillus zeae]
MSLLSNWLESLGYELEVGDHCLQKISPFSTCSICVDSCPEQAIVLKNGVPEIIDGACNGCGRCVTICPVSALKGQSPSRKTIGKCLVLDEGPAPTENELLYLYKRGIRTIYMEPDQNDKECTIESAEVANSLLEGMKLARLQFTTALPQETLLQEERLSRRGFFEKISLEGKKLALSTVTPANWRFNQDCFKRPGLFPGWSFFDIALDVDSCTICEICIKLCPEQAFAIEGDKLVVDNGKCSGCLLCTDVCQDEGISVVPSLHKSETLEYSLTTNICKECGTSFYGWNDADSCIVCSSKKKNGFLF